jgi:hypothetical protein
MVMLKLQETIMFTVAWQVEVFPGRAQPQARVCAQVTSSTHHDAGLAVNNTISLLALCCRCLHAGAEGLWVAQHSGDKGVSSSSSCTAVWGLCVA